MNLPAIAKKMLAEFLGVMIFLTAITAIVVTPGAAPMHTFALAGALVCAILVAAPYSGAHLNPAVSLFFMARRELSVSDFFAYVSSQLLGAVAGTVLGSLLRDKQLVIPSLESNLGTPAAGSDLAVFFGEVVATGGLLVIIGQLSIKKQGNLIPWAVGLWVTTAALYTVTGAQANPAVTFGRLFAQYGLSVQAASPIFLAEAVGVLVATLLIFVFSDRKSTKAPAKVSAAKTVASKPATPAKPAAARKPAAKKPTK